ncbi:MAG: hypothetical protein ACE5EH_02965 [Gammaproteobacteria bacterium]
MKKSVISIGMGEMGGVFSRAFLRIGRPVYPVTRSTKIADAVLSYPAPELVLVAVAEGDLHATLSDHPED